MELWNIDKEIEFFNKSLENFSTKEKLFYLIGNEYFAYIPNGNNVKEKENSVLQSRNSIIGSFTEKWSTDILSNIAKKFNLYALNGVVCNEIGLSIIDPFIGSGTTAVAAIRDNRYFIGYEINKNYIEIANERINSIKNQNTLF